VPRESLDAPENLPKQPPRQLAFGPLEHDRSTCYRAGVLNRKFADLRHAPELDPRLIRYDPAALPQAVVAIGPNARVKAKGGVVLAEPGFTWAMFFYPGRWYAISSVYDARGRPAAHHVDLCVPPEEGGGMLSFLDLKLDLLILPGGEATWLDQDDYAREIEAGTIPPPWQRSVADAVATLDRERRAGAFPPPEVQSYRPRA
jgi:predicted RNA-binding protein associated with RNAse of E/G family